MARPPKTWARFGLAAGVCGLVLLPLYRSPRLFRTLEPLELLTARATTAVLSWGGVPVRREGLVLRHPSGFGYEIYYGCTGLLLVALLAAGVLALPGRRRAKLGAVVGGASLILALNLVRLVSLFYVGVRWPLAFDFAHEIFWETAMLGTVLAFWLWWLRRSAFPGPQPGGARQGLSPRLSTGEWP